jgi:UDP-glucose/GDP-mannose dehydrogenase family protein
MLLPEGAVEAGSDASAIAYQVVSNPEFLREGSAIYDSLFPDRIVVGADSREAIDTLSSSELIYEPLPENDPKRRCPDITRAKEVLGWEPRTPTRDGLKRILSWFAERVLKIS